MKSTICITTDVIYPIDLQSNGEIPENSVRYRTPWSYKIGQEIRVIFEDVNAEMFTLEAICHEQET